MHSCLSPAGKVLGRPGGGRRGMSCPIHRDEVPPGVPDAGVPDAGALETQDREKPWAEREHGSSWEGGCEHASSAHRGTGAGCTWAHGRGTAGWTSTLSGDSE